MNIHQRFSVSYAYDVIFSRDIFSEENTTLLKLLKIRDFTRIAVFIDQGVADPHPRLAGHIERYFQQVNHPVIQLLPGGEEAKNNGSLIKDVLTVINEEKIDRHSYVLAIGGGAILDMVGFATAIAHRGVRHIRIPTTVLAQNDSGVGVKNGINYYGKKNFLGTFTPPLAVINDVTFLTTLEERDWRAGISEAIKVALLKDSRFYDWLKKEAGKLVQRDLESMETLIRRCAELHVQHIAGNGDPFELGSSRPLDFGHWSAHKMEQLTHFNLRHGEAVAIGIALDVAYAAEIGLLDDSLRNDIVDLISSLGLAVYHPVLSLENRLNPEIALGIEEFREHLGGELTITLISAVGQSVDVHSVNPEDLDAAVLFLKEYSSHAT